MSELSSSLMQVLTPSERFERTHRGGLPLMMEFPVDPRLGPFLVSRASSDENYLWVGRAHNGRVRAGVRPVSNLTELFMEAVDKSIDQGQKMDWGNTHPLTKEGLEAAVEHVKYYDFEELEILANPSIDWGSVHPAWKVEEGSFPVALLGLPLQSATWLRPDTVVVVPRDRSQVGFVLLLEKQVVSVVSNPSRTFGIATVRASLE
jgi:hypothetical protein